MKHKNLLLIPVLILIFIFAACSDDKAVEVDGDLDREPPTEWDWDEQAIEEEAEVEEGYAEWEEPEYVNDTLQDAPYPQLLSEHHYRFDDNVPHDINSIMAVPQGGAYFGGQEGLYYWNPTAKEFEKPEIPEEITTIQVIDMAVNQYNHLILAAYTNLDSMLYAVEYNTLSPRPECNLMASPQSLTTREGLVHIGTSGGIFIFNEQSCTNWGDVSGTVVDIDSGEYNDVDSGNVDKQFVALTRESGQSDRLWRLTDGIWEGISSEQGLSNSVHRSLALYMPRKEVWLVSDAGLQVMDHLKHFKTYTPTTGQLPVDSLYRLAIGSDGVVWGSGKNAIIRQRPDVSDRWDKFNSPRWLIEDKVRMVGYDYEGSLWVTTSVGVSRLYNEDWTLEQKSEEYIHKTKLRHMRESKYLGLCEMEDPGDIENCQPAMHENEAFYTAMYSLAMTFRAAALNNLGDHSGLEHARKVFETVLEMFTASRENGVVGAPATIIADRGEGPVENAYWYRSDDYDWRGNVDRATLAAYIAAMVYYHQLIADDNAKKSIAGVLNHFVETLIANDMRLIDKDGQPTDEGYWDEEHTTGDTRGTGGLAALQALAILRGAYAVTGNQLVFDKYIELAEQKNYALSTETQKKWAASRWDDYRNDLTSYLSYMVLMRFAKLDKFRQSYNKSLIEAFEAEKKQLNPIANMTYGAFFHNDFMLDETVEVLRDWPVDLLDWRIDTCERKDVTIEEGSGVAGEPLLLTEVLPQSQRKFVPIDGNPYECEWEGAVSDLDVGGKKEYDATGWLLSYWMGRYFGLISE